MAPIKQEEQLKDKLEKRSLQPSSESWATLANRLDSEQNSKNKSLFWLFGVAASITGIVFVTTLFFNNNIIENNAPTIVDIEHGTMQEKQDILNENSHSNQEVIVEVQIEEKNNSIIPASKSAVKPIISEKPFIQEKSTKEDVIAQVEKPSIKESVVQNENLKTSIATFEEQKIQDVVAEINNLKASGKEVSDAEIDNLLEKAQKEILSNRIYNENTRTVDANALLQDVEDDLQQSFRSKVFEALQSGYESVKTAVAERNN